MSFSEKFFELTLQSVSAVINPFVIDFMEKVRAQYDSIMPLFVEYISRVRFEEGIFSEDLFVASLQVFFSIFNSCKINFLGFQSTHNVLLIVIIITCIYGDHF